MNTVRVAVPRKGRPLEAVLQRLASATGWTQPADDIIATLRDEKAVTKGTQTAEAGGRQATRFERCWRISHQIYSWNEYSIRVPAVSSGTGLIPLVVTILGLGVAAQVLADRLRMPSVLFSSWLASPSAPTDWTSSDWTRSAAPSRSRRSSG
jgi:hypothetical protein